MSGFERDTLAARIQLAQEFGNGRLDHSPRVIHEVSASQNAGLSRFGRFGYHDFGNRRREHAQIRFEFGHFDFERLQLRSGPFEVRQNRLVLFAGSLGGGRAQSFYDIPGQPARTAS